MRKMFLFGFLLILLLAIPLTLYFVRSQTSTKIKANAATTLSLSPPSTTVNVGDPVNLDIMVNPTGGNQITFVKLAITYDATKLSANDGALVIAPPAAPAGTGSNPPKYFQFLAKPTYSPGLITAVIASPNPSDAIQSSEKIATITFNALAPSDITGTTVAFDSNQTSAGSNNCDITNPTTNCQDQPGENVLISNSSQPATVIINGQQQNPTITPTPTTASSSGATGPTCTGIQATPGATESASIDFTVTGNATPGATISKVTFNFGDGNVEDITDSGGVGTTTVNAQTTHAYSPGTYTANAILTDNNGATSSSNSCSQIITINGGGGNTTNPTPTLTSETSPTSTPTPTVAQSGSQTVILSGALGITLITIGAVLLLAL